MIAVDGRSLFSRSEIMTAPGERTLHLVLARTDDGRGLSPEDLRQHLASCADVNELRSIATWLLESHAYLIRVAIGAKRSRAWELEKMLQQARQTPQTPKVVLEPGAINVTVNERANTGVDIERDARGRVTGARPKPAAAPGPRSIGFKP